MPKAPKRVRFNKIVGVNRGKPKKLKRVNATNLAYDVLTKGTLTTKTLRKLVKKHKQHGSTQRAIKESIKILHKMDMRLCKGFTSIGACTVKTMPDALKWSDRLSNAKTILKSRGIHINIK